MIIQGHQEYFILIQYTVIPGNRHPLTRPNTRKCKGHILGLKGKPLLTIGARGNDDKIKTENHCGRLNHGTQVHKESGTSGIIPDHRHRETTVRLVVNGMDRHPLYKDAVREIKLRDSPITCKKLQEGLREEKMFVKTTPAPETIQRPTSQQKIGQHTKRGRGRWCRQGSVLQR